MRGKLVVSVCLSFLLVLVGVISVFGAEAGGFLAVGPGGKVAGNGGAYVTSIEDATASYWNPAGLARLDSPELVTILGELHNGILETTGISVAAPTKFGVLGATWVRLGTESIPRTTDEDGYIVPTGEFFEAGESAMTLAFARALTDKLSVGAIFKNIIYNFDEKIGRGNGWDLGLRYDINDMFSVGLLGQHINTTVKWTSGTDTSISPKVRIGALAKVYKKRLTLAADVDMSSAQEREISWGVAYALGDNIVVRLSRDYNEYSRGIGFNAGNCEFSYDWIVREGIGYVGYFSTRYEF